MRGVCLNTLWHLVTGLFKDRYYWARIFFIKFINDMKFWRYNKQYCTMVKLINFRLFIWFFCPNNYCAVDIIILKIINYWSWNLCIALNTEYNILIWFFFSFRNWLMLMMLELQHNTIICYWCFIILFVIDQWLK